MKYVIEVPDYSSAEGMHFQWEDNWHISVRIFDDQTVVLAANAAGLISLARHLLGPALAPVPTGYDFHLDASNGLDEGSQELVIRKQ